MVGVLRRGLCLASSNVLWEQLSPFSIPFHDQICHGERCLSGASASSSSAGLDTQLAISARRRRRAIEIVSSKHVVTLFGGSTDASRPIGASASALRSFTSAAATASAPSQTRSDGGAKSVGASIIGSRFLAPWPWVDPSRPQVLPISVPKRQTQPVPLSEALDKLLIALPVADRARHNLEVFIRFRLDPRRSDHLVRGSVVLPYGTGKAMRLVVFAKGADAEIARSEGVDLIGDEELISAIVSSDGAAINFDRLIATPDFMKPLARAGKVLGPKGLMPNPKMGTLTSDVAGAIRDIRRGRLDYRLSREATVRAVLGRGSMTAEQLAANVGALVASLIENRPKALAGPVAAAPAAATQQGASAPAAAAPTVGLLERYFMTFYLKTNHSPSVAISLESLSDAASKYGQAAPGGVSPTAASGLSQSQPQKQQKTSSVSQK
ncbi:mitochondrial ribosomal protein L1, imported to mitochondria [Volvox carteri f. nagariensis]|uniref:CL1 n=1 Tax=Volvox carteri f. nagariensis TaxID=3068 RepID=D8THM0_VOLCA|nr:mitochondrial ribosomal protein L1, imported to mitochondria [Volvox carteri f. nagariensis]EFJ53093.1 mitochondrial ribosomal protein L1, imported to mitochondria [Volvox carteri f. nagariensis]|eukprot:XP_002946098.1 mitochondrial ribosomal protein L1, imported to mitochondria [Volvox carteri f. nagariensis]